MRRFGRKASAARSKLAKRRSLAASTATCSRLTGSVLVSCSGVAVVSFNRSSSAGVTFCTSTTGWPFSSSPSQLTEWVPAGSLPSQKVRTGNGCAKYGHLYSYSPPDDARPSWSLRKALPRRRNAQPRLRPVELILLLDLLLHSKLRKQGCHAPGSSPGDDVQQRAKCQARRTQTKPPGDRGDKRPAPGSGQPHCSPLLILARLPTSKT
jgi:hypothetical protein